MHSCWRRSKLSVGFVIHILLHADVIFCKRTSLREEAFAGHEPGSYRSAASVVFAVGVSLWAKYYIFDPLIASMTGAASEEQLDKKFVLAFDMCNGYLGLAMGGGGHACRSSWPAGRRAGDEGQVG